MGSLEKRVAQIEGARAHTDLKALSDQELDAHIGTLDWGVPSGKEVQYWGTPRLLAAVLEKILRHGSSLPIVVNDPERKAKNVAP
jgi:hypothetical protein